MQLSISKIKTFKACRRKYELRYVEKLIPEKKAEALETGSSYHKLIEELSKTGHLRECDYSREYAMAKAYEKYIYPNISVEETEKELEYKSEWLADGDCIIGFADGIADDGHIVEHKTYGGNDSMEAYEYNLEWDEQILMYMLMTGMNKVWYTVCRKPTIRKKKGEEDEEFYERMLAWYDEDPDNRIKLMEIERTQKEVAKFERELKDIYHEMKYAAAEELRNPYYRNTCHCSMWGSRCEYDPVCLNYDRNLSYIGFKKGE